VATAMGAAYSACGYKSEVRVTQVDREGARIVDNPGQPSA
jgi:hypothetical protein